MPKKIIRAGIETFSYNDSLPRMAEMLLSAGHGIEETVLLLFPELGSNPDPLHCWGDYYYVWQMKKAIKRLQEAKDAD